MIVGAELEPHVRCVVHTLNLASQKALKLDRVSELLVKVRKVVTYFHKIPQTAERIYCPSYTCPTISLFMMFPQDGIAPGYA